MHEKQHMRLAFLILFFDLIFDLFVIELIKFFTLIQTEIQKLKSCYVSR